MVWLSECSMATKLSLRTKWRSKAGACAWQGSDWGVAIQQGKWWGLEGGREWS